MNKLRLTLILLVLACGYVLAQGGRVLETLTVKSEILKADRLFAIYLPPGYDETDQSYPVLYLLHGGGDDHTGWVQFGQVQHIADKAIAEGKSAPMIIVMPDANTGTRGYFNNLNGFRYEDFFFQELMPFIEKNYRTRTERRYRAIAGLSMGGGGTIFYSLHRPELFAAAAPLSASTGSWDLDAFIEQQKRSNSSASEQQVLDYYNNHSVAAIIEHASEEKLRQIKQIRWYMSCGDDDFLYEGNSRMHILFRQKEIPHEFRIKDGGHTWSYWRMELPDVMDFVSKSFTQF